MGKKDKLSIRKIQILLRFVRQVYSQRSRVSPNVYYKMIIPQALKQFS